jgi:hypothetical protein
MSQLALGWHACSLSMPRGFFALLALLLGTSVLAQAPAKKPNLFDDNPAPPKTDSTAPRPAGELGPGIVLTVHEGSTADGIVRERHILLSVGVAFNPPAVPEIVAQSFTFDGVIEIPPGRGHGVFRFDSTGDCELTIDGKVVSSKVADDPARTFNPAVNLDAGMHTLAAKAWRMHGTGAAQAVNLMWESGGRIVLFPKEWCFHPKTDEAPGMAMLKAGSNITLQPTGGMDSGWTDAGTPRPPDPTARPNDILPRVVFEVFDDNDLRQMSRFTTIPIAGFRVTIAIRRPDAISYLSQSYKLIGILKIDADCTCAFDCQMLGTIAATVDGRIVSRITNPGNSTRDPVRLSRGNHSFELAISRISEDMGAHITGLGWSVNGAPFTEVPLEVLGHYRAQEPYANNVAVGPGGGDVVPPAPTVAPPPAPPPANPLRVLDAAGRMEWERLRPALAHLAANPNDPADNLAVGRFYCFTAGDWQRGAAALALCGDPVLAWLGRHEATASQGADAQLALAHGWWDAADGQVEPAAGVMRQRAAYWYRLAEPNLLGMSHRVAQKRIARAAAAARSAPPLGARPFR